MPDQAVWSNFYFVYVLKQFSVIGFIKIFGDLIL